MSQQQQHAPGGYYSGSNKIPSIQKFVENLDKDKKARDKQIDEAQKQKGKNQTGEVVDHVQEKPTSAKDLKSVTDPITGKEIQIDPHVSKEYIERARNPTRSVPNQNLGKDTTVDLQPDDPDYQHKQDILAPPDPVVDGATSDVPIHGEKTTVTYFPTPTVSHEPAFAAIEKQANTVCICLAAGIVVVGKMFGGSLKGLIPLAAVLTSAVFLWMKEVVRSGRENEWESEKQRGKTAQANLIPESVEWLNSLMAVAWQLINPDMFAAVSDTIEDVMAASLPSIIEGVRISEIDQGSNPLRILSLRSLPDDEDGIAQLKRALDAESKRTKDPQEAAADEEGGKFYNLEVSMAYHAAPAGKRLSDKSKNMHMCLQFALGVKGLFGVPIPIWVELNELVVTARIRLAMTSEPPFLKNLTFTLMSVPHVQAGCIPMMENAPNILNLPLISNFVNYAIGAAASMYVAPKSMSLDMRAMLQGDDIQKDVNAIGVLFVRVHRATGLSKQDRRGSSYGGSDPYVVLSFSKYQKPLFCSRVIEDDLQPIWEEATGLLVTPEVIKVDEKLSIELWDSDRHTADDVVGKIELSMQKMIQHPGKMYPLVHNLSGTSAEKSMPGELSLEVGFFGKTQFRHALRTDGKDENLPENLKDQPELQDDKGVANTAQDDAVQHTPPDPLFPSGIVSVIVHQIVNLQLENIKGSVGNRKGREYEPAKPYGETSEASDGKDLPTSYCSIYFNDELQYRTRQKSVSSSPIFNAGTERFVRDFRSAIITIAVRDSRNRQHDPLLGIVPLKLTDILTTSSQVTRWYPLDGGVGFGRIRISLLFRSVELRLPPNQLGWDVGTFEFASPRVLALNYDTTAKIRLRTGGSSRMIEKKDCHKLDEGDGVYWDLTDPKTQQSLRLPVKYRYRSPVVFEIHGKKKDYAVIWLQNLQDNEITPFSIPIWRTANPKRLIQNYITEANVKGEVGLEDLEEVGRLQFRGRFKAGMDESHIDFISDNSSRETYEVWEACLVEGVRQRQVDKEVPELTQELHEKSLTEGRDVLKNADPEERKKWLAKDGTDWTGAFGTDPKEQLDNRHSRSEDKSNYDGGDDYDSDSSNTSLGIEDGDTTGGDATKMDGSAQAGESPLDQKALKKQNKRTEERRQRGLMQWKPARNAKFAKDEAVIGLRKIKGKLTGSLEGRKPDVETETG